MPLELFNVGINLNFNLKELGIRLTQVATIYSISPMFSNLGDILWRAKQVVKVDLLFFQGGKRYSVEFNFNEAPKITKSMHAAVKDLSLNRQNYGSTAKHNIIKILGKFRGHHTLGTGI